MQTSHYFLGGGHGGRDGGGHGAGEEEVDGADGAEAEGRLQRQPGQAPQAAHGIQQINRYNISSLHVEIEIFDRAHKITNQMRN